MGFKQIYQDIIRSPSTLITALVAIAIVGYVLYKSNNSNAATSDTTSQGPFFVAAVPDAIPGPTGATGPQGPQGPIGSPIPTPVPSTQCPPGFHYVLSPPTPSGGIRTGGPAMASQAPQGHCVPNDSVSGITTKIRPKNTKDTANGVNVYASAGGKVTGTKPYGSSVLVTGTTNAKNGTDYYPINGGGFIKETDLVGLG